LLGLSVNDLKDINCEIIDIADDFTDRVGRVGLKDIVYYLFKAKIQSYDPIERVNSGHNCEIDSRFTLKSYFEIEKRRNLGLRLDSAAEVRNSEFDFILIYNHIL